jgi:hypothetical protein
MEISAYLPSTNRQAQNLPPLQTTFPHKGARLQRPRPTDSVIFERQNDRAPPPQPGKSSMKRQDSQGGLRNLFTRGKANKVNNSEGNLAALQESQEAAEPPRIGGSPLSPTSAKSLTSTVGPPFVVPGMAVLPSSPLTPKLKASPPGRGKSVKKEKERPPPRPRPVTAWDPPPLFQAYPQAVKHGNLQAPTSSTSSILRASGHRRNSSLRDDVSNVPDDESEDAPTAEKKKDENRKRSASRVEWTQKIYVLVTSGYLLQYAGEGNFDRLPEKMMQIGKDSAAFASDAIPGKHWVLQISQTLTEEGVIPGANSKSLFSRLGFRGADARRATRSFLLIFDNPEEMDSWLVTVRREIEAMGGKKYEPENGPLHDPQQSLDKKPSRRYLVKRDPNQFGEPRSPTDRSTILSFAESENGFDVRRPMDSLSVKSNPRSSMARPSTGALSIAATNSTERSHLEQLRQAQRLSYMSSGTRNETLSQNPSPPLSPISTNPGMPGLPELEPMDSLGAAITTTFKNSNRMSIQNMAPLDHSQKSIEVRGSMRSSRPNSTYGSSSVRSISPGTPNFSVPTTKRYSFTNNPPPLPTPPLTASTLRPSPSPSPPTVVDSPPTTGDRPSSFVGDLAPPSRASSSQHKSRRHSHRDYTPPAPNYAPPQPPVGVPSNRPTPPPSRPTSKVIIHREPTPPSRPVSSKSEHTPRPTSSKSDSTPRPKRLSSLEYSLGISPATRPPSHPAGESISRSSISPPHPPPTIALPPVPWQASQPPRPTSSQSHYVGSDSSGPRKLRRPVSMQVRTDPIPTRPQPVRSPSHASAATSRYQSLHPHSSRRSMRPATTTTTNGPVTTTTTTIPIMGNAFAANPKILPRKSMPALGPPAPPPNIPLPDVPAVPPSTRPYRLLTPPELSANNMKQLSTEHIFIVPEPEEDMLPEERIMVQQERARAGKFVARRVSSSPGLRKARRESQMHKRGSFM